MPDDFESRRQAVRFGGIVAGVLSFFVLTNIAGSLSQNWFMGFLFGGASGFLIYNIVPMYILGRKDPLIYNPHEEFYYLSPANILGQVTKDMKRRRYQGYEWQNKDKDEKTNTLLYSLKFEERDQVKEGIQEKEFELLLNVHVYQDPRSSDVSFLNLAFWEAKDQPSMTANEIVKETTETIYSDLKHFQGHMHA